MRGRVVGIWCVVACSAPASPPQRPDPIAPADAPVSMVVVDAAPNDAQMAAPIDAAPTVALPAPGPITFPSTRPEVGGPGTRFAFGTTIVVAGVTITSTTTAPHKVQFAKGTAPVVETWAVKRSANHEVELVAHGVLFVLRSIESTGLEVVLVANPAPAPTDCKARIDDEVKRLKLKESRMGGGSGGDGIVSKKGLGWRAHCGQHTGRLWIEQLEIPPMVEKAMPRPPVRGTTKKITWKQSIVVGDVTVKFTGRSHAHKMDGGSAGFWEFSASRGGKQKALHLESEDEGFEGEVDALGSLLVFRHRGYEAFEIVQVGATPRPKDCEKKIESEAKRLKLAIGGNSGSMETNGIMTMWTESWTAYCGTFTGRVWFVPPKHDDD